MRAHLGLKLLDSEKEWHTLSPWQLHCDRCIVDAIFLLKVDVARAVHIEFPRDLHAKQGTSAAMHNPLAEANLARLVVWLRLMLYTEKACCCW